MLHNVKDLRGHELAATDGDIGKVDDLLFDDLSWTVRYLVVDTGGWLTGRLVLISPISLRPLDREHKRIPIALRKEQVEKAPGIDVDRPVSRQYEGELSSYYGWPRYWGMGASAGVGAAPVYPEPGPLTREETRDIGGEEPEYDPHLRSIREVTGYHIEATDHRIGHVDDFVIDDDDWMLRYLVVDTGTWLPGRKVLVPPAWATEISWPDRRVSVNVTRDDIRNSPEYHPDQPLSRGYEEALYESYRRPGYWTREAGEAGAAEVHKPLRGRPLQGLRVAVLVTDNFERVELTEPREALHQAGATTSLIAPRSGEVQSMEHDVKADSFHVDMTLDEARPEEFDAALLPGGVMNADRLRMDRRAQEFVRRIDRAGKPVAVICHGPWLLISAGLARDRTLTSYYTLQDDATNAGGRWLDREVVRDRNWVSSRGPSDIPAFNREMLSLFAERAPQKRRAA